MPTISEPEMDPSPYRSRPIPFFVGPNKTEFYVHKDILNANTPCWSLALSETRRRGPMSSISLPDEDPAIVSLFLEFIYRSQEYTIPQRLKFRTKEIFVHAQVYYFGEKYGVLTLQDYAISQIHSLLTRYHATRFSPSAARLELSERFELIQQTYKHTTSRRDELRKLLARDFAMRWETYRHEAWKDGDIDNDSQLGKLFKAVPRFERDLLLYVGSSIAESLPTPASVPNRVYLISWSGGLVTIEPDGDSE